MSTFEYNDLFLKCQPTGKYHVFTFDIVDSKKMSFKTRYDAQFKIAELILMVYKIIEKKQLEENKKILVFEEEFTKLGEERKNGFGYKQEPFIYGDLIGFTVYRDAITSDEVINIFNKCKKILEIDFEFHIADCYYETNNWIEGTNKYFRGYCIDLLSNLHKPYNKQVRKALIKQKNQKT